MEIYGHSAYTPLWRWLEETPFAEYWHSMKRVLPSTLTTKRVEQYVDGLSDEHVVPNRQNDKGPAMTDVRKE